MSDQAAALRKIADLVKEPVETGRSACQILSVASGKGGVGKSNLSLNLSIGLARLGQKVLMLDADIGAANIDILLGLDLRRHLGHVLAGDASLFEILHKVADRLYLVPGASGISEIGEMPFENLKQFREDLVKIENMFDCVIVDCSAGVGPNVTKLLRGADRVLLVCGDEPTAIVDAYALCKALFAEDSNVCVEVVVNNVPAKADADEVYAKLGLAVKHFLKKELRCLGHVVHDEDLAKGVVDQKPVMFTDKIGGAVSNLMNLAEKLARPGDWARGKGVRQLFQLLALK